MEDIWLGTSPNSRTGDSLRTAGGKINLNFAEVISRLHHLETLPPPVGLPGAPGESSDVIQVPSSGPTSSFRVMRIGFEDGKAYYATPTDEDINSVVGVSLNAVSAEDQPLSIQLSGELSDPSFSFVEGPIYLGSNGSLTQTPPSGAHLQIGSAAGQTSLIIRIQTPIT